MIKIKTKQALEKMRVGGRLLAQIMREVEQQIVPGVTTAEINAQIEKKMRQVSLEPVCIGYAGYKHATCISVNDIVVHGIPSHTVTLQSRDCVSIDVVGSYKGYCVDMARTFLVGEQVVRYQKLVQVAQQALDVGIAQAVPGAPLSNISAAIQDVVERAGFGVIRDFVGHGIGRDLHEDPQIPNFGKPGNGPKLQIGMTLAIEPMIVEHAYDVHVLSDGWSVRTLDGGYAAHVEDTIAITAKCAEILTRPGMV